MAQIKLDNFDKEGFIAELDRSIGVLGVEENKKYLGGLEDMNNLWSQVKNKLFDGVIDIDLFHQLKIAVDNIRSQSEINFL
ncbi:MAG: hypothetical protein A2418_00290 [Candidatus Brennerbacteria bacterium RIFOXYC1_FULL_41_11]|uniref:Uncharacterized protein n=1 Tax=Candidatus Brennerbacteria bacterium RIFOXYD1_FULL_41_16 TaxID=1797529 RepID=A0A1G1XJU6_9BACT|nr:MAG: hypothetical protein A2391_01750 [Candidatus Brennerbacteria bacterium RIFOXYB1_FULL_41_13]OGY39675.1 MAG: hypothetical protein A2418_00290 [Candidatus Brennerbacteria bacterium RIFOXYC1_FULL_41_11]OGY40299.1 MAG: hypothetical protein A2570_03415 [Candidatus Brennerbacteria bacterium RIFOXYD1_FULL_41_16]